MRFCRGWSLEDMILSEAASSTGRFHSRTTGGNASSLLYSQVLKSTNHLHALYWIYMSVCVCVCYREQRTQPVHLLWILRASVLVQSHHELLTETHEEKKHPTLTPDWRFDVRDVWCVIFRFYATNFTLTLWRSSQVIMLNLKLLRFFSLFSRMCRNYLIIIWLKVQPVIQYHYISLCDLICVPFSPTWRLRLRAAAAALAESLEDSPKISDSFRFLLLPPSVRNSKAASLSLFLASGNSKKNIVCWCQRLCSLTRIYSGEDD